MPPPVADDEAVAPLVWTKEPYKVSDKPRKIKQVRFGIMSAAEIMKNGVMQAFQTRLYQMPERSPHVDGVLDPRLGISNKHLSCKTCGQTLADCTGHFGYVQMVLPVFHIGYFKQTMLVLHCICKHCSRVLLDEQEALGYLRRFRTKYLERLPREALVKKLLAKCKLARYCPHCGEPNGTVKKAVGSLKIVHEKYADKSHLKDVRLRHYKEFQTAIQRNPLIEANLSRVSDDLNPLRVLNLFRAISARDAELLDMAGRPEDLLVTALPVPPVVIRPSVEMDSGAGSNEDDCTMRLMQIIDFNNKVRTCLETGVKIEHGSGLIELWDFLQVLVAGFINSDLPGLPQNYHQTLGKPLRGFVQRLKGKQGRFRGNLSGKRVDFTGRTVISPDPNLGVHEVGVPKHMAMMLTFPELVTEHNINRLRQNVLNGANKWPGANLIMLPGGSKFVLRFQDRSRFVSTLKVGDLVERHLQDGDIVLFNRQPSLHRVSIMAHRVRVVPSRTLRFNECVCNPYNADFDGDEMNLHVPQTQEARTEAASLMGVLRNLCTPKNGDILVAATQDFLTSSYLLTAKDVFHTREQFGQLVSFMGDALDDITLPPPAIIAPQELWTGKQLFTLLIRPNKGECGVMLNMEAPEKKMHKQGTGVMCPNDGWVCFHNGDLVCGRLGKGVLGDGNKDGVFHVLITDFSADVAAACMNRLAKLSARFIGDRGFSIGIDDVSPAPALQVTKASLVRDGIAQCDELIRQHAEGTLKLSPGMGADETLEARLQGLLSNVRTKAGDNCMTSLSRHNSPLIMSQCGSKGSPVNIAQMVACVGQQVVNGKRAPNGFRGRSLPHFPRGDRTPEGKGFVASSFYSGLGPTEFFFHTMAGREGLVDTAVKTADTGYMSRRLMKGLEDLHTHHDTTVRSSAGTIVQLAYGDDGLDPLLMEGAAPGQALNLKRLMSVVRSRAGPPPPRMALPGELRVAACEVLQQAGLPALGGELQAVDPVADQRPQHLTYSSAFVKQLHTFLDECIAEAQAARERFGLPLHERADSAAERAIALTSMSLKEVTTFLCLCIERHDRKRIDPGSTVGAFGAQSIGEPGTQMTLKTFHFAGVAAMNITLGVPRIKEIINAAKKISTPIVTVALDAEPTEDAVRALKAGVERTTLGQITSEMKLVLSPNAAALHLKLDLQAARQLHLHVTPQSAAYAIGASKGFKDVEFAYRGKDWLVLSTGAPKALARGAAPKASTRSHALWRLQSLMTQLPGVVVAGVPSISRAVMNRTKNGSLQLFAEGLDLRAVMGIPGVDGANTQTNHVMETWQVLGIEAARAKIIGQIDETMASHGMAVDSRHTMLLADCMTYKGEVLGIQRFGLAKMKDSVLMLASFEKTTDHLFDAALHGRSDEIDGVSESIIMGIPVPCGTGMTKLVYEPPRHCALRRRPDPVLA